MPKDALGHGSNPRGGAQARPQQPQEAAHQAAVNQLGTESSESRELRLFGDNDGDLNRQSTQPIRDNLGKKMDKGSYDPERAAKLWQYHADRAAQSYAKQFGDGQPWHKMFPTSVRKEAARHWERSEREDIKSGSSRTARKG